MMQTILAQIQLPLVLISLSLYIIHSHGSPVSDSNNSSCPPGWYQYEQFCVTRGHGSSDRDVALYCDGFGGIGINGLCIIKIPTDDLVKDQEEENAANLSPELSEMERQTSLESVPVIESRLQTPPETDEFLSPYRDLLMQESTSSENGDVPGFSSRVHEEVCPRSWTHYGNLCVFKPWNVKAICHLMAAVEFHGLCVKHADLVALANMDDGNVHRKEKRICCCANFKARGNKYGC